MRRARARARERERERERERKREREREREGGGGDRQTESEYQELLKIGFSSMLTHRSRNRRTERSNSPSGSFLLDPTSCSLLGRSHSVHLKTYRVNSASIRVVVKQLIFATAGAKAIIMSGQTTPLSVCLFRAHKCC